MADKLTIKQETFCNKYIELGNASEAYRQSYNASNMKAEGLTVNASKLLKNTKVALRVKELQASLNKKYEITREFLTEKYLACIANGESGDNYNLVRQTCESIAKLHGLIVEKAEIDAKVTVTVMDFMRRNGQPVKPNLLDD